MSKESKRRNTLGRRAKPDVLNGLLVHPQAGRPAGADAGYQRLLKARPTKPDAWRLWGVLAAQQAQFDVALERSQLDDEALALRLATQPYKLAAPKPKLERNRQTEPLLT